MDDGEVTIVVDDERTECAACRRPLDRCTCSPSTRQRAARDQEMISLTRSFLDKLLRYAPPWVRRRMRE